jgi:predicted alpha/beta superfamily hydrolase
MRLPQRPDGRPWPPVGGADVFLRFIEGRVKPLVRSLHAVDESREVLVGHSFGGLFALHTLFTRPQAFDAYVAGSPSLWFNDRHVMDEARVFAALPHASRNVALFLGVGGLEQTLTPSEENGPQAEQRRARKAENRMVDNARDLADLLRPLATNGLRLEFRKFEGDDHASVVPPLLSRGLSFALAADRPS